MGSKYRGCRALVGRQVVAWTVSAGLAGEFYVLAVLYLSIEPLVVLVGLYSLVLLGTFLCALQCSIRDCSDFASTNKQVVVPFADFPKYCVQCRSRVGARSIHCEKCAHCIAGFDHHCDWLNVCIGRANYRYFYTLICGLEVNLILQMTVQGMTLGSTDVSVGEIVGIAISLVLCAMFTVVFAYLIGFHMYISVRGLTTFEYMSLRAIQSQKRPLYTVQASQLSLHISSSDLKILAPPSSLQLPMDRSFPESEGSSAKVASVQEGRELFAK